jgi:hypothetical protein
MNQPAAVTEGLSMPLSTVGCRQCHELYRENCELRRELDAMRTVARELRDCLRALHLGSRDRNGQQ